MSHEFATHTIVVYSGAGRLPDDHDIGQNNLLTATVAQNEKTQAYEAKGCREQPVWSDSAGRFSECVDVTYVDFTSENMKVYIKNVSFMTASTGQPTCPLALPHRSGRWGASGLFGG